MPVQTRFHFRRKVFVLSICLVVSTVLWLLNDLNRMQTTMVQIPVRFSGLPYDMVPTNSLPSTMEATIEATGFNLLYRHFTTEKKVVDISLKLDQGGVVAGRNYLFNVNYYTDEISKSLGSNIKIRRLFPDTFSVRFEKKFVKKVPIRLSSNIQYEKEFYQSGSVVLQPDSVLISGVKVNVEQIDSVCTKNLVLKETRKTYEGNIGLEDINGISYNTHQVNVKIPIQQFTQKQINVQLKAINVPANYELNLIPDMASLNLLVPISMYNTLSPSQFVVTASFPEKSSRLKKVLLNVSVKPNFVRIIGIEPSSVEFIIKAKE